ncbi:hypothetical protein D3C72_1300770 [compost metagenome]
MPRTACPCRNSHPSAWSWCCFRRAKCRPCNPTCQSYLQSRPARGHCRSCFPACGCPRHWRAICRKSAWSCRTRGCRRTGPGNTRRRPDTNSCWQRSPAPASASKWPWPWCANRALRQTCGGRAPAGTYRATTDWPVQRGIAAHSRRHSHRRRNTWCAAARSRLSTVPSGTATCRRWCRTCPGSSADWLAGIYSHRLAAGTRCPAPFRYPPSDWQTACPWYRATGRGPAGSR